MKLVQCRLRKRGESSASTDYRFIPAEDFDLWQHMMESTHGLIVEDAKVGLWLSLEECREQHIDNHRHVRVPVTRVSFLAPHKEPETFFPVIRYFLTEQADELTQTLLHHYVDEDGRLPNVIETPGVCLCRGEDG